MTQQNQATASTLLRGRFAHSRYHLQRPPPAEHLEVPSGRGFIALLEAFRTSGGAAPGLILDQLLREYRVAKPVPLEQLVSSGQLFGFVWRDNLWVPMFQFEAEDLALKACAQKVRARLPLLSGWALASWFVRPNERLDGQTPVDTLDSDFDAVLLATQPHNPPVRA